MQNMKQLIRLSLLILMLTFGIKASYSQMAGDYRSAGNGNWDVLATWQIFDGSIWKTPTTEGWPGQYTGTGAVTIQYGNTITISNTGITTLPMGTLTVSGTLYLMGTSSNATDFNINTQLVIVTPNLAPEANIYFWNKSNLRLPANGSMYVVTGGLTGKNCSNQQRIFFGSLQFYACTGGGGECGTFKNLTDNGGNPLLALTSGVGTNILTGCVNIPISNITYAVNGAVNSGTSVTGLPAGITGNYNSGIFTISGIPTTLGDFNYTVSTTGSTPCSKAIATGTITVNTIPTVTPLSDQFYCGGVSTSPIVLSGTPAGLVYDISGGTSIGLPDQTDVITIPAFIPAQGAATITITPKFGACTGMAVTYKITVNPTALAPPDQFYCSGILTSPITLSGIPAGAVYDISGGTSIGLPDQTGVTIIPAFIPVNGSATITITPKFSGCTGTVVTYNISVNPIAVAPPDQTYCSGTPTSPIVLSGVSAGIVYDISGGTTIGLPNQTDVMTIPTFIPVTGSATITITPKFGACSGTAVTYNVAVNPTPTVDSTPADQFYCSGVSTSPITLSGTPGGAVYDISGGTAIGLPDQTNATTIPAFIPVNGSATITITPKLGTCTGTAVTYKITVNPIAIAPPDQFYCSGILTSPINLSGIPAGVVYDISGGISIGLPDQTDVMTIPAFIPVEGAAMITIIPKFSGCTGSAVTYNITVNPIAVAPSDQTYCSGISSLQIALSGIPAGVVYDISGGNSIGLPDQSDVTTIPAFIPVEGSETITITPKFGGCTGTTVAYNITVNPTPTVAITPTDQFYCSGISTSPIALSGTPAGIVYDISGGTSIGLPNQSGVSSIPSFIPVAGTATITITPKLGACTGTAVTYMITVNPIAIVPPDQTYCDGSVTTPIILSGSPAGVVYDISGGLSIGLPDQTNASTVPAFIPVTGSATITITPKFSGCTGTDVTFNILVNPTPTAIAPSDQTYCDGNITTPIVLSGTPAGVVYDISGGTSIGLADQLGVTTIPAFIPVEGTAVITITPKFGACYGTAVTYNIVVNTTPTAIAPSDQTYCNGISTSPIVLSGTPGGVVYNITGGTSIGLADQSGVTDIPAFIPVAGTAVITITPKFGACYGTAVTYNVTVNPTPTAIAPSDQTYCTSILTSPIVLSGSPAGVVYDITGGNSIGLADQSDVTTIPSFSTTEGSALITITPKFDGCTGAAVTFNIIVNPIPTAIAPSDQTYCTSILTSPIVLSGSPAGVAYDISGGTTIGLANQSGVTTIPAFIPAEGNALITITPKFGACVGAAVTYNIIVNPTPAAIAPSDQTYCNGISTSPIVLSGSPLGVTFDIVGGTSIGLADQSGVTTIPSFIPVTGAAAITITPKFGACTGPAVTYNIIVHPTPTAIAPSDQNYCNAISTSPIILSGTPAGVIYDISGGTSIGLPNQSGITTIPAFIPVTGTAAITITPKFGACTGAAVTYNITVNPTPAAIPPSDQTYCNGITTSPIILSGTPAGVIYDISGGTSIGLPNQSGITTIPAFIPTQGTAIITITPKFAGCTGAAVTYNIIVNPIPTVIAPSDQTYCDGNITTPIVLSGTPAGVIYDISGGTSIGLPNQFGVTTIPSFIPVVGAATIKIVPKFGGCTGSAITYNIIVNPTPIATASSLAQTICSGTAPSITLTSSLPGTIFNWTVDETNETGAYNSNGQTIDQILVATAAIPGKATYTIIPTANGCDGPPITVVVTVNPIPTATVTPMTQTICTGSTTSIALTSDIPGTTFDWTVIESDVTGTATGSGSTIAQILTATTANSGAANYIITPKFNGCTGDQATVVVNVNPFPTVTPSLFTETICSGSVPAISLSETVAGTVFNWTVIQSPGVSGATNGSGTVIAETLTTTGSVPGTATYTITPTADGCDGTPVVVTVTVNPIPALSGSLIENACSNVPFSYIPTSNTPGAIFNWSRAAVVGIQNPIASGSGTVNETLVNITGIAIPVSYAFTVNDNGCTSPPIKVDVTVYPKPSIISTLNPTAVCNNTLFSYTPVPSIAGTMLTWSRAVVAGISNPAGNGTGDINETLINTTVADVIVPYVYTLTEGCSTTVTINSTIKPSPVLSSAITEPAICNNSVFSYVPASLTPGTTFNWTRSPVSGISNGFNFDSGNVSEALINITDSPLNVSYTYTLKANGCENEQDVTVAVNPTATVDDLADEAFCNGILTPVIPLTGFVSGASFNWTNDNPAIGLAAGGLGDIPSFTATNNTGVPISALIKVTPSANGCDGIPKTFHITVEPSPVANIPVDQVICNGVSTAIINFSGTFDHITWTNDHPEIGLAASGSGNIAAFTGTNPGSDPIIAKITVTAHPAISGSGCDGIPFSFLITVNPTPVVDAISNQTFCAGSNNSGYVFSTSTTGGSPTFNWTSSMDIGFGTSGSGSIPSFTANNGGSTPLTATVSVTAAINGCTGNSTTFAITVNPAPTVDLPSDQAFCNTATTTAVHFTGTATSFSWTNSNNAIGLAISGTGDLPTFTVINMGTVPIIATVTVTPSYTNGGKTCPGTSKSFKITVNPSPAGTISGTTSVCQGGTEPLITFTGANGTSPYTFTYKINGGADQTISTSSGNSVTVSAPITVTGTFNYTLVKVSTFDGCSQVQSGTVTIHVASKPTAAITGTTTICQNGATPVVTFTGAGGAAPYTFAYQINGGSPQTVTTISGNSALLNAPTAAPGVFVYSLISVSSASGCVQPQAGMATITVNSPPNLVINNPGAVCSPITADLTLPAITTGSTAGLAYTYWTDPLATTLLGTPSTTGNGTYYIKGTDPITGCFVIKSVSVTVNTTPILLITNPSPVCAPSRVDLTANAIKAGSTAGLTYTYWTDAAATVPYATPATADDDTYYIKGTSLTGCYAIKPVTASIYATIGIPVFALGSSSVICQGSAPVTYSATVTQAFTLKYSIDATSFASGNTIDTNTGKVTYAPGWVGTSQITATATGCGAPSTAIHTVKVNPSPVVALIASPASAVCEGTSVTLTATNSGGTETQTFTGSATPSPSLSIPNNSNTTYTYSKITLSGSGNILTSTDIVMITLNINHNTDQDLDIFLVDPSGTRAMLLSSDNGLNGNNYTNTVIRTDAVNPITGGTASFTGTYLPEGSITTIPDRTDATGGGNYNLVIPANALNGAPIDGSWSLRVFDDAGGNSGTIVNWSLAITKQIGVGYTSVVNGPPTIGTVNYSAADHKTATSVVTPPAGTNIYTVTTTNGIGCSTTSNPVSVVIKPAPKPTIVADYCIDRPKVRLTASSHASWLWNTGATTQTINVDVAGKYTVTVMDANGCTGTTSIQVADELVINGDFSAGNVGFTTNYGYRADIVGNSELNPEGLYGVGVSGKNYHNNFWGYDHTTNNGTGNFMIINGWGSTYTVWQEVNVTVTPNTDYYFAAWAISLNTAGPFAKLKFEIETTDYGKKQVGTTANLTAGTGINGNPWKPEDRFYGMWNSGTATKATIRIINLEPSLGGNDFGLDDISFGTLVNIPITVSTSSNSPIGAPICSRGTLELHSTVTGGKPPLDYTWTDQGGNVVSKDANPIITNVSPYAAGTYTLAVKDWYNCPAITSTTTVALNPTPEIPDQSELICSGSPFDATPKDGVPDASTYVKTGTTYSWPAPVLSPAGSITGANAGSALNVITQTLTNTTTSPATATYTVTPVNGTCAGNPFKVVVTVNPTATVNAGINQDICVGSAVQLNGSIGGAATSASWSGGTGSFIPNRNSLTPVYTPSAAEIAAGTVTLNLNSNDPDGAGPCVAASSSVTITINSLPALSYNAVNLVCNGASSGSVNLSVSSGTPAYSYTWTASNGGSVPSGQVNAQNLTNLVAGTYAVIVKDSKTCGATLSVTLTEPTALAASESHLNVSCAGQVASVIITATGGKTPYSGTGTFSQSVGTTTYAITDANGCTASVTANVTANPNTAPVITTNPVTRNFNGCTPAAITAPAFSSTIAGSTYSEFSDSNNKGVATDNCAITTVSYQDAANASCPITVTRTWTLGDASGLTTTCQQVLKITDIDKPTWTTAAGLLNKTVDCSDATGKANALALFPTAGDVCDPTVSNIGKPIKTSGVFVPAAGCSQSGTYTNSWKVTDACGNTSDAYIQVITITDNTPPTWTSTAGSLDRTLQCSDNVGLTSAKALKPVATDNCDGNVTNLVKVTGAFVSGGTCGQQGTYTNSWTVKDDCGNLSTVFKQVITLTDNTAPIWITAPGAINATVECDDLNGLAAAQALHPKAWDNCDINVSNLVKTSGLLVPSGAGSNEGTFTNTWVVKDDCGNTSPIYTQTITVKDNTAPIIYCPPGNAFSCNSPSFDPAVTGTATATDHCDPAPVITKTDEIVTTSCAGEYKIIRTWTAKDARGNSSSCQQTIFVQDVTPPVLNVPSDRTVDYHNPTTPSSTGTATATDNCDTNPIVSYSDQTIAGHTIHDYTIIRTWTAADCANNTSVYAQKITVKDFTALSITCQPAVTANTDLNQSWASNINPGIPTLTGSGVTYSWSMSGVTVGAGNGAMGKRRFNLGITTITWKAKNYSGTTTCTQTVTVLDKQPPTFSVTAASFVQCVEKLETAIYNIPTTDINPDRPDYYSLDNGSTLLNLNTATFSDNCSLSKCTVEIRWKIDLSDGTRIPDLSTPYNTGQPSTYGMGIKLTGDGINFSTLTHTITYWIVDCAGNVSLPKTRTIIIKPRPKLTKGNN